MEAHGAYPREPLPRAAGEVKRPALRRRRKSLLRFGLQALALLGLLAASLVLQARWLRQLADAQRSEERQVLRAAAERIASDVRRELSAVAEALGRDERDPAAARWITRIVEGGPDGPWSSADGPSLPLPRGAGGEPRRALLERSRLEQELFPRAVAATLGTGALERYRVTVRPAGGAAGPLYDSAPDGGRPESTPPDAAADLWLANGSWVWFQARAEPSGRAEPAAPFEPPVLVGAPAGDHEELPLGPAPYRLELRQRAGSLDRALATARRRNLWIGAGTSLALAGSLVLLWIGEQRARRLAERELALVAGVSHELRTPLAVIQSAASNLASGIVPEAPRVAEYGALIEREARRVGSMIEQVLRLGSDAPPSAARQACDLAAAVREAAERASLLADRRRFELELDLSWEPIELAADRAGLVSAVQNLLENAIKYGPDGQVVRVRLRAEREWALVEVADQGPGLAPGEGERLFEPFERGEAARRGRIPGAGLGLALVRDVARAHGGRVELRNGETGAVFTLCLPRPPGAGAT